MSRARTGKGRPPTPGRSPAAKGAAPSTSARHSKPASRSRTEKERVPAAPTGTRSDGTATPRRGGATHVVPGGQDKPFRAPRSAGAAAEARPAVGEHEPSADRPFLGEDGRPPAERNRAVRRSLLRAIGERVRALRDGQGMPRRTLAELSGVSPRFLAELEVGRGNISIARLLDVAIALETPLAALLAAPVGESPTAAATRAAIAALLDGRSEADLAEARDWIAARFEAPRGPVLALLGVRGAGKTSIGRRLAERLGVPFAELDELIEETAGLTLGEIFELHGEAYYRRLERETLAAWLARTPAAVLATGGSLVTDRESFKLLRRRATTIWLRARAEDHWNRVLQQGDQRPMAKNPHAMQELRALLAARESRYAEADHTVDTSATNVDGAVDEIITRVVVASRRATA